MTARSDRLSVDRGIYSRGGRLALLVVAVVALLALSTAQASAQPIQAHAIDPTLDRIDVTAIGRSIEAGGDKLHVDMAPGTDGTGGRMTVAATTQSTSWFVFAIRNTTDKPVERWLVAERFTLNGSRIVWPDLDARRIEHVTASAGFRPERQPSDRADIFRITLEPNQTITYAVELASDRPTRLLLWKPVEYEQKQRNKQLFNGIMLGITGCLAIFLTVIFAANHAAIFPSAALVAWCILALLCVDFGFWHKLFQMRAEDSAQYRAVAEASLAASLVIFLFTFLRLRFSNAFTRLLFGVWIAGQLGLVATAIIDPRLATTVARLSFGAIGGIGAFTILYLALRRQERALALSPTWMLLLVWLFAAAAVLTGKLPAEAHVVGLLGGLVLFLVLIGFTVTQFAFRPHEVSFLAGVAPGGGGRSLAIDGAGAAVFEWSARRDDIKVDASIEEALGLKSGDLSVKVEDFVRYMHSADRERFEVGIQSIKDKAGGALRLDFRMRNTDSSYRWFEVEATSVPTTDRRQLRCIGLIRDITDQRAAQERLLHDSVHDSLTGQPNRALFLDRLAVAIQRARNDAALRPVLVFIDLDKFKSVNSSFGMTVGDSLLLTIARRLSRHLGPEDTLARVGGDQFAILMLGQQDPRELAMLAERIRRALRAPIKIAGQEIVLTGSLGIAIYDGKQTSHMELLREAELAMYRAKRAGADRIEIFKPAMRSERDDRVQIESDLRRAVENRELSVLYQPIISLSTEELRGFEALVRWEHPRLGLLNPVDFVPVAEETDLIVRLGSFVLSRAVADIAAWQDQLDRPEAPLFVSVNVSSRQLIHQDLIVEVKNLINRAGIDPACLKLEITESLVMDNPEQATMVLDQLKAIGVGVALLACLPATLPDRPHQDRPLAGVGRRRGRGRRQDRALDRRSGTRTRQAGCRRGGRDAGGCEFPALHRVRVRAGLPVPCTDARARGAQLLEAHPQSRQTHAPARHGAGYGEEKIGGRRGST
ncbi:MAG TPA: diguanylate cyclase, partial [Hyphomicrobiaceae bacterium]|nr:diguanylate cyclase [Hyphomicrobiaceae bacterium]